MSASVCVCVEVLVQVCVLVCVCVEVLTDGAEEKRGKVSREKGLEPDTIAS